MKLVSFSVENYRSITTARKIPLAHYSLLVGANNEGKSNILHALTLAMNALVEWHRQVRRTADGRIVRTTSNPPMGRSGRVRYDWETDFPISKQKSSAKGATNITLEFELTPDELGEFKDEIKSNLNGTLPLMISFGRGEYNVTVKKQGPGQATLTKKSTRIADFVSRRIRFEYIPTIRTAESAVRVVTQMVERELYGLESNSEYTDAIAKIEELQQPILEELAGTIQATVSKFLPSVKSVRLTTRREERYRHLRRDIDVIVDDGHLTKLERKGDGVQSLVALALMRHASEQGVRGINAVVAIEEPESHLHPRAIHELKSVIEDLSKVNQVVLTSHSPLFVNPNNLTNTVIVRGSKAACASRVSEIRDALGVRFSDNLENARLVLLVEGSDDIVALRGIISSHWPKLDASVRNGTVAIDSLGGASSLRQKATFYQAGACLLQCLVDNDIEGQLAVKRAVDDKVLKVSEVNLCAVPHLPESELEDLYDKDIYGPEFRAEFGVDPKKKLPGKPKLKWSNIMARLFGEAGKPWNESIKAEIKHWLAEFAAANASTIIKAPLAGPLDSFLSTAENRIPDV